MFVDHETMKARVGVSERDGFVVAQVSDRRALQQRALEKVQRGRIRVSSIILKQAPHLAWKAPDVWKTPAAWA
jgi:hypothetical protein